ncbi:nitrilase [Rhizobiales bacterium]|uniref:nitrilase-related carbon-nitrogen hydrolase n=1 Tax=Hongsoonwoonella zoysiae TaxID=2821844 RepID=UPI0015611E4F|nr:nitrilase-related carbon-nitrogen hydrolase [Hongsoonwoonella zoysiae]NRG19089.1 nitrilase [Hongsoonwoonella zoysiae]
MPETFRIALWSVNLGAEARSLEAWLERVQGRALEARAQGARLLLMPEFVSEGFLAWKPDGLAQAGEIAWLASQTPAAIEGLRALVDRHGLSIVAGSMPFADDSGHTNRTYALLADGRTLTYDKLCLTPPEKNPADLNLTAGRRLTVFELEGVRIALLICLDVELPAISMRLALLAPDLILVPSMTQQLSGYHRVYGCAKARAVELMTSVAVCGTVGVAKGNALQETNVSGAALYVPCEPQLGSDGIAASHPPVDGMAGEEPFVIADVPVGVVRRLREGGAEVWPGLWTGDHIEVDFAR